MKDYHKLENELFARWEAKSKRLEIEKGRLGEDYCKSTDVIPDGMMYRGDFIFQDNNDWDRKCGDEYIRWEKAPLRLIMLTKDNIDEWDKRHEIACNTQEQYDNCIPAYPKFYKNYIRWIYCMLTPEIKDGLWTVKTFDDADDFSKSMKYMINEAPLVRINVKKQTGGASIKDNVLREYVNDYADEIIEQISFYDANVLFSCEPHGIILSLIRERLLPDLEKFQERLFYSSSQNVLVVNYYHPSGYAYAHKDLYEWLKAEYEDFLNDERYGNFPSVNNKILE